MRSCSKPPWQSVVVPAAHAWIVLGNSACTRPWFQPHLESWGSVLRQAPPFGFAVLPMPTGGGGLGGGLVTFSCERDSTNRYLRRFSCFRKFVSVVHAVAQTFYMRIVGKPLRARACFWSLASSRATAKSSLRLARQHEMRAKPWEDHQNQKSRRPVVALRTPPVFTLQTKLNVAFPYFHMPQ